MPRYSLRTLLIIVLLAGPLLALGWGHVERVIEQRRAAERAAELEAARYPRFTCIKCGQTDTSAVLDFEPICTECRYRLYFGSPLRPQDY